MSVNNNIIHTVSEERGISFLEFSIVAPLFLFFFMAIPQVGTILADKALLSESLRTSSRYSVSLSDALSSDMPIACGDLMFEHFENQMAENGYNGKIESFLISQEEFYYEDSDVTSYSVPALKLEAAIPLTCTVCTFIGIDSLMTLTSHVTLPSASIGRCSDITSSPTDFVV